MHGEKRVSRPWELCEHGLKALGSPRPTPNRDVQPWKNGGGVGRLDSRRWGSRGGRSPGSFQVGWSSAVSICPPLGFPGELYVEETAQRLKKVKQETR